MDKAIIILISILVILCCCCCAAIAVTGVGIAALGNQDWNFEDWDLDDFEFEFNTAIPETFSSGPDDSAQPPTTVPNQDEGTLSSNSALEFGAQPSEGAIETLLTLQDTLVPINDPRDLALRLKNIENIPEIMEVPAPDYNVGDELTFWVTNTDTNENSQKNTILQYETEHVYFWVEDGVKFNEKELKELVEAFENEMYPTNREFFGSEWTPGIDSDEHLYIVYTTGLGSLVAGYFSSLDSLHPLAHEYSNAHETFMMNADAAKLDEEYTYGILAHEFQHMIHWYKDRNETSWLNEGFSELAVFLNGYDTGMKDFVFTSNPDMQLNNWPNDPEATYPNYGASFLFVTYFLDHFGEEATQALVADPDNGMSSVDNVLEQLNIIDGSTDAPFTADNVFRDWTLANYLNNPGVEDSRYAYRNYSNIMEAADTEYFGNCPLNWTEREVNQYGTDYIRLECGSGVYTLNFEGVAEVGVIPEAAYSGDYAFWSNKGNESDMMLTQQFDFSKVSGPLSISYQTWYDLEEDYDYLYLEASEDGEKWTILTTPSGTDENPSGNSYGWGYNGVTNGWIQEEVDLSEYAGKKIWLRFEYVTDAAVYGEGFLLDDVSIPAIEYHTDFETDEGGWEAAGFARLKNSLPQNYNLSLIKESNGSTSIEKIKLDDYPITSIELDFNSLDSVVMVVSGVTRLTRQTAPYRFDIKP